MLELATSVQSEWIFMEAATNLLGRSNCDFDKAQPKLVELGISDLFNRKRKDFKDQLRECEYELLIMQMDLTESHSFNEQGGLNFFRQWLSERLFFGYGSGLRQGYAYIYRTIAERKLSTKVDEHNERMTEYLETMKRDGANVEAFAADEVNPMFDEAADLIAPLMKDVTRRQDKTVDVFRPLTFMGVSDDELPWVKKA